MMSFNFIVSGIFNNFTEKEIRTDFNFEYVGCKKQFVTFWYVYMPKEGRIGLKLVIEYSIRDNRVMKSTCAWLQ